MSHPEPTRLLAGGLIDGEAPSPEMFELLATLRSAAPGAARVGEIRSGALSRAGWGRWLVPLVLLLVVGAPWTASSRSFESTEVIEEDRVSAPAASPLERSAHPPGDPSPGAEVAAPIAIAAPEPLASPVPRAEPSARRERRAPPPFLGRAPTSRAATPTGSAPATAAALSSGEDTAPGPEAIEETPPSPTFASALSEYARGCCDCAIGWLQQVIEGSTDDGPRAVRRSELLLGTCLARLGWDQSARTVLDAIVTSGPEHPYFSDALGELARLAPRLPDPSVLVSTFRHDDETRLNGEGDPAAAETAAYFSGRARYDDAELERAVALFARVTSASPFHRAARFYQGIAEVRLRHSRRAEAAFREVIDLSPEGDRFRDMATLALARLYYSAAQSGAASRSDAADTGRESALLARALTAWRRVPISSEQFLDAFFEESWALYLAGDDERALGHVFGLLSPFFEDTEHPEAYVIRGTIHYEHCLYDEAEADVRDFHTRYDAVLPALDGLLALGDDQVMELHASGRALEGTTRAMVSPSIHDRDTLRRADHARAIEAELARVAVAPFGDGPLGARLTSDLSVELSFARTRVADGVRERIVAVRDALVARMNEMDTIALETTTARRDVLTGAAVLSEESRREREVIADLGYEVWPFDGEYWEDEVTTYREVVRDRCGR